MDLFNLTPQEVAALKQTTKRSKQAAVFAFGKDREGLPDFVGRRCFYYQEYCVFDTALKNAPKFDKIPKDLLGFNFPEVNGKPHGILEMCDFGSRFYNADKREKAERERQFKLSAVALKEKYKSHTSKTFLLKKSALEQEYEEFLKKWPLRERKKPAHWDRLAHFKTLDECHEFLTTIGYTPKF